MPRPDLAKPIPASDPENIFPPNENYDYFRDHLEHPFNPNGESLQWVNASWCADAALLAYFAQDRVHWECDRAGFHDITFIDEENTQCFIARTDQFALIAFRGTTVLKPGANLTLSDIRGSANAAFDSLRDVLTDASIIPSHNVHLGFRTALDAVWSQIEAFQANHRDLPVWFTGHSLGAALAVLAANQYQSPVGGVYTFGAPVIGDQNFTRNYRLPNHTYRFVNNNDWLPKLNIGYQHIGQLRYISSQGDIRAETNLIDQLTGTVSHAFDVVKNWATFKFDTIPSDAFRDHAPIYYATHIWNYYVHQL